MSKKGASKLSPAKFRAAMKRKGMNVVELSAASGVSITIIYLILKGASNPMTMTLSKLAGVLSCTVGDFYTTGGA